MKKYFILFSVLILMALFHAPAKAGEPEIIKIGVCLPLSGEFQNYGNAVLAGLEIGNDLFEKEYPDVAFRLELLVRDEKSNAMVAADIVDELAAAGVPLIIGSITSDITLAMVERAKAHGVVIISPGASSPVIKGASDGWAFKMTGSDTLQGIILAEFAKERLNAVRAAGIINTNYQFGDSIFQPFAKAFKENGGEIVVEEHYQWNIDLNNVFDFTPILEKVKSANPDIVLLPGYAEDSAEIIRQAQSVDLKTIFVGGDGWFSADVILASGNFIEGAYHLGGRDDRSEHPAMKRFIKAMETSNTPNAEHSSVSGFDAITLVVEAAQNKARTGSEFRNWLNTLTHYQLASVSVTYEEGQDDYVGMTMYQIVRQGDEFVPHALDIEFDK